MKRLFLAIPIVPDDHFMALYMKLMKQLKFEKMRWVEPGNLHITLKFFGNTPVEKINIIDRVLHQIVANVEPMEIEIEKTGIFGSRYKPRVIWFGIGKNKQLELLAHAILTRLDSAGFALNRQNFVPHLSLGRLKSVRNKVGFQSAIDLVRDAFVQTVHVDKITLFESILEPTGVTYKVVKEYKLSQ